MPTWEALHTQENGVGPVDQEAPHGPEIIEAPERDTSDPRRLCWSCQRRRPSLSRMAV